jgi:negative regulator of sigma E activity
MSITELTRKVQASGQTRSLEEKRQLLERAGILDRNGHLSERFKMTNKPVSSDK